MAEERLKHIKDLYEAEQQNPSKATRAGQVPESYELIEASWLQETLGRHVKGAEIVSFELGRERASANLPQD